MSKPELPQSISEVIRIGKGPSRIIFRDNIPDLVESPLIESCCKLFDKGIQTVSTSANNQDNNLAHIQIDFNSLSEDNKSIALSLNPSIVDTPQDGTPSVYVTFEHSLDNCTPQGIEDWSVDIANEFQSQAAKWVPHFTLQEGIDNHYFGPTTIENGDFYLDQAEKDGYYYSDRDGGLFFFSPDHRQLYYQGE